MRKAYLGVLAAVALHAQSPKASLLITTIPNINSKWPGECSAKALDNRSTFLRNNNYHAITLTSGSGSWTAAINFSDTSCAGPWTSFGSASSITQASNPPIAYGNGNHPFIQIVVTGNAVFTYAGENQLPLSAAAGSVAFPVTIPQGGTGATSLTAGQVLFGNGASPILTDGAMVWDNVNKALNIGYGGRTLGLSQNALNLAYFNNPATDFPVSTSAQVMTLSIGGPSNAVDNPPSGLFITQYGGSGTNLPGVVYGNYQALGILSQLENGGQASPIAIAATIDDLAGGGTANQPIVFLDQIYNGAGGTGFASDYLVFDIGRDQSSLLLSIGAGNLTNVFISGATMTVNMTATNAAEGITTGSTINILGSSNTNNIDGAYTVTGTPNPAQTFFTVNNTHSAPDATRTDTSMAMLPGATTAGGNVLGEIALSRYNPIAAGGYMGGWVIGASGFYPSDFGIKFSEDPPPNTYLVDAIQIFSKNPSLNILNMQNLSTADRTTGTFRLRYTTGNTLELNMNTAVSGTYSTFVTPFGISSAGRIFTRQSTNNATGEFFALDGLSVNIGSLTAHPLNILYNDAVVAQFDGDSTAGNTRFIVWDVTAGATVRVSRGAADSGGAGFRVLRIPN